MAFDFDGVIADDEAETVFKRNNDVDEFHAHETLNVGTPHRPARWPACSRSWPPCSAWKKGRSGAIPAIKILRIAIITARNAPSHERVVTTLKSWGVAADETFFSAAWTSRACWPYSSRISSSTTS